MAATGHNIQTTADTIAFRDQTTGEASISYDHSTEILSISGTNSVNFDVDVDMAAGLDVTGNITMTGATVATQSWVSSQNYLTSETDDQTLNEVLTQGNSSELGIDVGPITGDSLKVGDGTANSLLFYSEGQYNTTKFYGVSDQTASGIWEFKNTGTWNQTRFYIEDANNSSSRLTLDVKGNAGAIDILAATSHGNVGIGTTSPSSKLHVGDGTADDFVKVFFSDNTNLDIHGYGIEFNRSVSYLRPTTNANKTLTVGTNTRNFNNIYFYSSGSTTFHNANDELVRIDSAGNVGIGTVSPSGELHISNTSDFFTDLDGDDSAIVFKEAGGNPWRIGNKSSDDSFRITQDVGSLNTSPRFTIANGGNVGINDTTPSYKLDVNGTFRVVDDATFNSDVVLQNYQSGTVSTAMTALKKGFTVTMPESNDMQGNPYFMSDLAYFNKKGGTVTATGLTGSYTWDALFRADAEFVSIASSEYSGSTFTLELSDVDDVNALSYGAYCGITFGASAWMPSSVVIEFSTDNGSTYTTALNSSASNYFYYTKLSNGAATIKNIKFTIGLPSVSSIRIANIFATDYNGQGMKNYFVPSDGGTYFGDVTWLDSQKAKFGSGSDLQIYHDGSNSYINDTGTGDLIIYGANLRLGAAGTGEQFIRCYSNGAVELYYDNSKKLETANNGVNVTGNVIASNNVYAGGANGFVFGSSTSEGEYIYRNGNDIRVHAGGADRLTVDGDDGNVGIGTTSPSYKLDVAGNAARIGNNLQTTTSLFLTATNTAGAPARAVQTVMAGYEGRGIGTFYTDTTYSGEEWFCGMNYSGNFDRWSIGYDQSGGQPEYLANALLTVNQSGNVGIGTTSPAHKLTINAANNTTALGIDFPSAFFDFSANSTSGYTTTFHMDDTGLDIGHNSSSRDLNLKTAGIDRFIIEGGGNIISKGNTFINDSYLRITAAAPNLIFTVPSGGLDSRIYNDGSGNFIIGHGTNSDTPTERLRILSGGQLIVGGTTYGYSGTDLQVGNTSDSQNGLNILTSTTGYGYILFGDGLANADSYVGQISYKHGDDYMAFRTAGTEKIRITSSGEVGIGTVSPVAKLQVKGADSLNAFKVTDAGDGDGFKITSHTTQGTYVQVYDASHTQTINLDARSDNTNRHTYFNGGGNVGIGTTSPDKKLNVHSGATSDIVKFQNNNGSIVIGKTANLGSLDMASDASFRIRHGSTVSAFFKSDGNVGIGTTSPAKTLDVSANGSSQGIYLNISDVGRLHIYADGNRNYFAGVSGNGHRFTTTGGANVEILNNGNVGIGTTSPAQKLHVAGTILADTALATTSSGATAIGIAPESEIADSSSTYPVKLLSNSNNAKLTTYHYGSYLTLKAGVEASGYSNNWSKIELRDGGNPSGTTAHIKFFTSGDQRMDINDTGNVTISNDLIVSGNLTVNGTTTTINSTTVQVDDKNIELGTVASPTDATADGGGITLKGATDKTINWVNATDSWTSNQNFSAPSLTLTSLSNQASEATALMINGSNVVGTRELSTSAFVDSSEFASASHTHAAGDITSGTLNAARLPRPINGDWWNGGAVIVGTDGVMEVGKYLDFHTADSGGGTDYDVRVTASNNAISVGGSLTATSLIKYGGTSSEFLKADGSVDSNTYLTTGSASSTYLPLIGGDLSGNIEFTGAANAYVGIQGETDVNLKIGSGSGSEPRIYLHGSANGQSNAGNVFIGTANNSGVVTINGAVSVAGSVTATSLIKSGGSSSEFLKADGSVDSNTYSPVAGSTSLTTAGVLTVDQLNMRDAGDYITFYGDDAANHSIGARNASGNADDDIRINSYGSVYINLDSNNNNSSIANFLIGRHGGTGAISDWLFKVDGENGNVGIGTTSFVDTRATGGLHLANATGIAFQSTSSNTNSRAWRIRNDDLADWGSLNFAVGTTNSDFADAATDVVMTMLRSGNVGIGTTTPSVGLQVGNSVSGETKTVIFNSEGGTENGLLIKSRTNRAKLSVADNDTSAYMIAEGSVASFGMADTAAATNISVRSDGDVGIGTTNPDTKLHIALAGGSAQLTLERTGGGAGKAVLAGAAEGFIVYDDVFGPKMYVGTSGTYNGNVGIGTISPSSKLHVAGQIMISPSSGTPSLKFQDSGTTNAYIDLTDGQQRFDFRDDSDTVMSVTLDTLRVGIGTTSPATSLEVNGSIAATGVLNAYTTSGSTQIGFDGTSSFITANAGGGSNANLKFYSGSNAERMVILSNGNVGIGRTSPVSKLHVYQNDAATSTTAGITIEQDGTGDAQLQFLLSSVYRWVQGIDNSDGDKFKIGRGNDWSLGEDITITTSGEVGIGTTSPSAKLEVNGHFAATTKSFIIDNPEKGGRLQYGVVETDEHSVYVRGKSDQNIVELPEEWGWLVDEDSVTVQLTSIGQMQHLFVIKQNNKYIEIGGLAHHGEYNYVVYGTRKDVGPLKKHLK